MSILADATRMPPKGGRAEEIELPGWALEAKTQGIGAVLAHAGSSTHQASGFLDARVVRSAHTRS